MKLLQKLTTFILLFGIIFFGYSQNKPKIEAVAVNVLPEINQQKNIGLAGMMGGVYNNVIVLAGGANFPEGKPWEGGKKIWSDAVYVIKNNNIEVSKVKLPFPLAYGASVSTPKGVFIIGGDNATQISNKVFKITYENNKVNIENYPDLPEKLSYTQAVFVENTIYVIGGSNEKGSTNSFYKLDISLKKWDKMPNFKGSARSLHSAVVQESSHSKKMYLIGGRTEVKGRKSKPLSTMIAYNFTTKKWENETDIEINGKSRVIMGASAEASGSMHFLVYGGSDEILFDKLENAALLLKETTNDSIKRQIIKERDAILNHHPGFSKEVMAYNTMTNKWYVYDSLKAEIPITALSYHYKNHFHIASGEIAPGVRTPKIYSYQLLEKNQHFGWINYVVLVFYLLISLLIGFYFSKKQKSTNDYFSGGGRIPWWASGLSVFGTLLSAITFMAIPAKAFITDWSFFMLNIAAILITPLIALLFIPFFNRLKIKTAYEFLEDRFNYFARALGSFSFILFQLGRIGIVLLLPSLAISIVTGIPVETSILIMGFICIVYTAFGGIEAVIWTDVMQVIVLMGGSVLAIVWILLNTETPFTEMVQYASENDKFHILNMDFNFTDTTFWVVLIGGLASAMVTQGTDQTIVQRYLTSSDVKNSQKTLYTNAVLTLPATIIFFGIGTLLFIFYTEKPQLLSPVIANNDSVFPWYIVNQLPIGVSGLLIAGIFSAAMSSISSSLNSVSTAFCNDFYKHYRPEISDKKLLKIARWATIITGIAGVSFALWMANSDIKSLWDQFYKFLGLFTGGLGGMFLLGMLTKKANAKGTLLGLFVSGVTIWYVSSFTKINFLMYTFIGVFTCFVFGYLFSLVFKNQESK